MTYVINIEQEQADEINEMIKAGEISFMNAVKLLNAGQSVPFEKLVFGPEPPPFEKVFPLGVAHAVEEQKRKEESKQVDDGFNRY